MQQNTEMLRIMQLQQQNYQCNSNIAQQSSLHVVTDYSKTIDKFSGEKGPVAAKQWLDHLETSAKIHRWPDEYTFEVASSNLCGAAHYWLQGKLSELRTWSQFKQAFTSTFTLRLSKTECWQKLQNRVQGPKESIHSYFCEKIALCKDLELTFAETKEQVAIGLWSRELYHFVMSKVHMPEDHLYQDIINFEKTEQARRALRRPSTVTSSQPIPSGGWNKMTDFFSSQHYHLDRQGQHQLRQQPAPIWLGSDAIIVVNGDTYHISVQNHHARKDPATIVVPWVIRS